MLLLRGALCAVRGVGRSLLGAPTSDALTGDDAVRLRKAHLGWCSESALVKDCVHEGSARGIAVIVVAFRQEWREYKV